jgi:hypothetical protein
VTHPFTPDWTLAPAATLREWMEDNNLSVPVLAVAAMGRAGRGEAAVLIQEVLDREPLTERHALVLQRGTGVPGKFWLALEHGYRSGLAAGLKDITEI